MALSGAEKQRRYRERQKAKLGEAAAKAKEAAYQRSSYRKNPEKSREQTKLKVQSWRASKKAASSPTPASTSPQPYSAASSLSRAMKRARDGLPGNPEKRRRVVEGLVKEMEPSKPAEQPVPVNPPPANKTPDEVKDRVREFYLRQDISWTAPGRRDSVTVIRDGQKVQEQRHYLMMTVAEAYALFQAEFPMAKVSLTLFKSLRPDVVLLKDSMPHNLCVCTYHENVNLILQGLRTVPTIPLNHKELLNFLVCDSESEECMYGKCDACKDKVSEDFLCDLVRDHLEDNVDLYQWIRTPEGKTEKVKMSCTVKETLELLSQKLKAFKVHCLIKSKQAAAFQHSYSNTREGHATVQIDFSENATVIPQDEVQSGHWGHLQVTLFTAVAWTTLGASSFCVVSDCLAHDKYAAAVFVDSVIDTLQRKLPFPLEEIDLFSDGAAQHFKQKFMFVFITSLFESRGIKVNWHFFATSHGKGAVDGIGGTIKRTVFSAMKTRRAHVGSAEEYAQVASDFTQATTVMYVSQQDIDEKRPELSALWDSAITVPNTQSVHCVRTVEKGRVTVSSFSDQPGKDHILLPAEVTPDPDVPTLRIAVGKWYAVYQDSPRRWCVGHVVSETGSNEWEMSFIRETGTNTNRFRPTKDVGRVSTECIFTEVESPAPASSTRVRVMKLTEDDYNRVKMLYSNL